LAAIRPSLLWTGHLDRIPHKTVRALLGITVCNRYSKRRLGSLGRVHLKGLRRFAGVVIAPEPDHLLRELCRSLARIMCTLAETEVKVMVDSKRPHTARLAQRGERCDLAPVIREWALG
jgi:hypothetical protein